MRARKTQTLNLKLIKKAQVMVASFLKKIVSIKKISEQNSNGYCNVDFVFTLN